MVSQLSPTTLLLEPGAPGWAARLVLRLAQQFAALHPIQPVEVWRTVQAELPPAASWAGHLVIVTDLACIAISDGTNWRRINLGAPI